MNLDFLKQKVFQIDGFTITVLSLIILGFIAYYFILRKR